jgi:hypothetical protein
MTTSPKPKTTKFYVATLARYVLVDAETEDQARKAGQAALYDLYADLREQYQHDVPINIRTIRPATQDEIDLWNAHHEDVARENERNEETTQ